MSNFNKNFNNFKKFHKELVTLKENGLETLKWILQQNFELNRGTNKSFEYLDYVSFFNEIEDRFFINSIYPHGSNFFISLRTSSNVKKYKYIEDFYPYFFAKDHSLKTFIESLENKYLVTYYHPGLTKEIRKQFRSTFEADILYDIRFFVDIMSIFRRKITSNINFRIWYADIEVYAYNINKRFTYDSDENFINAINIYDNYENILYSYFVKDDYKDLELEKEINGHKFKHIVKCFKSEGELLYEFFWLYLDKLPDFLVFWNAPFDMQYIFHKSLKYLDKIFEIWNLFDNIKTKNNYERIFFEDKDYIGGGDIYHILLSTTLDLLALYRKSVLETREEYSLDYISRIELGENIGKVKYEGSLENLYDNNFETFIDYSSTDALLLFLIDKKLELVNKFVILSDITYLPIRYFNRDYTTKLSDALYMQHLILENKCIVTKEPHSKEKYVGAHVHLPIPGIYNWFIDLDASSMYPSIIISANISPDTFLYSFEDIYKKVKENNEEKLAVDLDKVKKIRKYLIENIDENNISNQKFRVRNKYNQIEEKTLEEIKKELEGKYDNKFVFTPAGVIFRRDVKGVMPIIMDELIRKRKEFKMMKKFIPE